MTADDADDFDRQFFQKQKKVKLTKDQKRALKFAAKQGVDLGSVGDLEGFLQNAVQNTKKTHNTNRSAGGEFGKANRNLQAYYGNKKVSDYKDLEDNNDL